MKKLLFTLFIAFSAFYLSSCSSDETEYFEVPGTGVERNYHVVTYNVDGWESVLKATPIESSGVKSMLYLLYNEEGSLMKQRIWSDTQNLNVLRDTLPQGNYHVVFYASSADDVDANIDINSQYFYNKLNTDTTYFFLKESVNVDMFYSNSTLTVGKSDVQQNVTMPRIVGKVEVLIQDATTVPTDVKNIQIALAPDHPTAFGLTGEQTLFTQGTTADDYFLPVTSLMTRDQFLAETAASKPLSFTTLANTDEYNHAGTKPNLCFIVEKTSGERRIIYIKENLVVTRNQVLRLQGNLFDKFDGSVGVGNINVEDEWGATVIENI